MASLFGGKDAFSEAERTGPGGGSRRPIIPEFYLKVGESKSIVFCDDSPEVVNGHKIMVDAFLAPRWFTCSQGLHDCLLCEKKISRTWIGPMTVLVDTWTEGKTGNVTTWGKRILMASATTLKKLKIKKDNRMKAGDPGLVGCMFSLSRVSKQNVIDDCEFLKRVAPKDLGVADFTPLDYTTLLAARPRADVEDLFSHHAIRDCFAKRDAVAPSGTPGTPGAHAGGTTTAVSY
jgi:hypothetical protein